MSNKQYNADSINVLSDLQHMQLRRGMYIGEGNDPRQLLSEIFDNAMDEVQAGFSTELIIYVDTKKNEYTVRDFGRGIPHGKKELEGGIKKEIIEVLLTKANSGGKFNNESYAYSAGLNGLGLTITNALSNYIEITSYRKGKYVKGYAEASDNVQIEYGTSKEPDGTNVRFKPNPEMFHNEIIPIDFIQSRCEIASSLGFKARLVVDEKEIEIKSSIFDLMKEDDKSISTYTRITPIEVTTSTNEKMKVAIKYTSDTSERLFGYTNLLSNYLGGTHTQELSKAVSEAWRGFLDGHKKLKPVTELKDGDFRVGMRAVCAVFISHPEFSSQTKEKLVVNKKYFEEHMNKFKKEFINYLDENIVIAQQLLKRFEEFRVAQNALLSRKEISSLIKINNDSEDNIRRRSVVSKLVECTSKKRENTELFLVEGDSACLRWNTKIRLANDTEATIKDVCERVNNGETIYVYGKAPKGTLYHGPNIYKVIGGGITRKSALLYRVYLDNGTYVDCTDDHKFMLKDRSFKEAKDLIIDEEISIISKKDEYICKVSKFESLNIYEDVYDIEVDEVHNFCLANDIIVHNCGPYKSTRNKETQAILPLRGRLRSI